MFGKMHSEETKLKLSITKEKNNPAFGKTPWNKGLTKDTNAIIQRMAQERTGKPFQCKHSKGYTTSWKGKCHSMETKEKLRLAAKRRLMTMEGQNNIHYSLGRARAVLKSKAEHGCHHSQSSEFKAFMREMNHKMVVKGTHAWQNPIIRLKAHKSLSQKHHGHTWIEQRIGWLLDQLGIEKEAQKAIPSVIDKLGIQHYIWLDWFLPKHNLAIECDGEYWHTNLQNEEKRDALIRNCGYCVLHLRETEIMKDLSGCKNRILGAMVVESVEP